jgi:hypothetical protein
MIRCIYGKWAHWGIIFEKDKEYNFKYIESKKVRIINDYDKYWNYQRNRFISGSKFTKDNLHEVVPSYKYKYTIEVELPFINVNGDDNNNYPLIILTKEEIVSLFNITLYEGKIPFCHTYYLVDEYFDFTKIRRDKKLKEIGI